MSSDAEIEQLIEALQQDGPSERDAARLRARLSAAGIATASVLGHGTATASVPVAKAAGSVATSFSTRWASLALLPKMGVVAAVSAAVVGGPIYGARLAERAAVTATFADRPTAVARHAQEPTRPVVASVAPGAHPRAASETRDVPAPPGRSATAESTAPRAELGSAKIATVRGAAAPGDVPVAAPSGPADPGPGGVGTARFVEEGGAAAPLLAPSESTLAAETALLDATFAALRAGDAATAATLVAEHARRFPRGLLWRERERARAKLGSLGAAEPPR